MSVVLDDVSRAASALAARAAGDAAQRRAFEQMFCLRYGVLRAKRGGGAKVARPAGATSFSAIAERFGVSKQWAHRVVRSMLEERAHLPKRGWVMTAALRDRLEGGRMGEAEAVLGGLRVDDALRFYQDVFDMGQVEKSTEEPRLSKQQFDCLVDVGSFRFGRGLVGARLVLVDGLVTSQAARQAHTSKQNVSNTKRRLLRWHEKVQQGYPA